MKVMVMVKATAGSEAGDMPSEELLTAMGNYNQELVNAGIMLAGEGLHPSRKGVRVRFSGEKRNVTDGPFTETKELIAGFWMWKVKSMQEAIEWVKRCPNPMMEDSDIEIRPVFEAEDFGETFTPELREQEASIRAQALGLGSLRFKNQGKQLIAGLNEHYTLESRQNIPLQWERFIPHFNKMAEQVGGAAYGICNNYESDKGFDYLTGVEVKDLNKLPAGFTHIRLPSQRYAIFSHTEHVSSITATLDGIWTKWVSDCGLKIADAPCIEKYTEAFNEKTGLGGMEIWIPIKV